MITDLNTKVEGKEAKGYEPIPVGVYEVVVETIKPWVEKEFKGAEINLRDEDGFVVKDENDKIEKVKADFTAYSADVVLKITEGDFKDRLIFANVTTHPDVTFLLDQFIYATVNSCVLTELQDAAKGKNIRVNVGVKEYKRTITDPNTAIDRVETKTKNYVKAFYKTNLVVEDKIDLGL